MATPAQLLSFDLALAMSHLSAKDEKLAELILATAKFQKDLDLAQSPYEALMESIPNQPPENPPPQSSAVSKPWVTTAALPLPKKCSSSKLPPSAKPACPTPKS